MPLEVARAQDLVDGQSQVRAQLTVASVTAVLAMVRAFTGWYDTGAITNLCDRIVARLEPAQLVIAGATDAFYAQVLSALAGRTVSPAGPIDVSVLRKGITHQGAFGRLADQYRWEISTGTAPDQVLEHVVSRTGAMVLTESTLVVRDQATKNFTAAAARTGGSSSADVDVDPADGGSSSGSDLGGSGRGSGAGERGGSPVITGYRRVIHPELATHGSCGLCVAASDQLYGPTEPMPIHDRCNCVPLPVYGSDDPGSALNDGDLTQLYGDADGTDRGRLKATRYTVHDHGELGPVLTRHGAAFRTPRVVAGEAASSS